LWYNENVGEDDRSVDEAFVPLNGLEREGRCDFGAAAAFEEIVLPLCFVVFGEIASGYVL
jgi:hypothetical protein